MILLVVSFHTGTAQPCDMDKGSSEIQKLYEEGYFDQVLDKTKVPEDCISPSEEQNQDLLIPKYKCLRNISKYRKSLVTLEKLKAYMAVKNIPLDIEIPFILAEIITFIPNNPTS